jgi:hypothetical protein
MASHIYYDLDDSLISDAEYDALSEYVAQNWEDLEPIRKWQIGSPEDLRATGMGMKLTALTISAARNLFNKLHPRRPLKAYPEPKWKQRDDGLRYTTIKG